MLNRLTVQNVALIERADVEFSEGLNVISGETGAGKSVLLDSIDFVLGAKADKSMIRYGADECTVRAEFSDYGKTVSELLKEFDIEPEDVLVISRKFTAEGKGGIKINGCGATLSERFHCGRGGRRAKGNARKAVIRTERYFRRTEIARHGRGRTGA